jgi:methionine salvage enolase-phosphatase E1
VTDFSMVLRPVSHIDYSCIQAEEDVAHGVSSIVIPPATADTSSVVEAVIAAVTAQMDADRKSTALKALQVFSYANDFDWTKRQRAGAKWGEE